MRILTVAALAATLLGSAALAPPDGALAQGAAPAGHQYVVGVSGMT